MVSRPRAGRFFSAVEHVWKPERRRTSKTPARSDQRAPIYKLLAVEPGTPLSRKEEIYSTFSHILKNPLVGASGYIDYLFKGYSGPLSEEQLSQLGRAREAIVQLQKVIDIWMDILAFDLGLIRPHTEIINLTVEINRWISDIRPWASAEERIVLWQPCRSPLWARIEPKWIRVALQELLSNAVRVSPRKSHIRIGLFKKGKNAIIKIKDEGPGVPAGRLEWIFQPLTQLRRLDDPPRGDRGGLGLALVRNIVQLHAGTIHAASPNRRGLEISLSLPFQRK